MKVELFEITADCTPIIFASEEAAGRAASAMARGMVATLSGSKLTYVPVEPLIRRIEIDVPRHAARLLACPGKTARKAVAQ
ncbi:MAG: hypothetical protein IJQ73_07485 [Kiritimatiellae bacterium]|nr:hypothetical protein [Kiritimatiellia bacterium]